MILKAATEVAENRGERLWLCFVDLEKAYDRICRSHMWRVFEEELGMDLGLLSAVKSMYKDIRA